MPNSIPLNSVPTGSVAFIAGTVRWSRIASHIDGEELQRDIARRQANGSSVIYDKPYTTITIDEAHVLYGDPNQPSQFEQYLDSRCYRSNSTRNPAKGMLFTNVSRSPYLPPVAVKNPDGSFRQIEVTNELANNQPVILVMRVYPTRRQPGLSLDGILVDATEVKFRSRNNSNLARDLQTRGLVLHPMEQPLSASEPDHVAEPTASLPDMVTDAATVPPAISNAPQSYDQFAQQQTPGFGQQPMSNPYGTYYPNQQGPQGITYSPESR